MRQLITYQNLEHEWEKISSICLALLRKQIQHFKNKNELKLKVDKSKIVVSRLHEHA